MQPEHQLGNEELYHIVTFYSCVLGNVCLLIGFCVCVCVLACFPNKTLTLFYILVELLCVYTFIFALYKVLVGRNLLLFIKEGKALKNG